MYVYIYIYIYMPQERVTAAQGPPHRSPGGPAAGARQAPDYKCMYVCIYIYIYIHIYILNVYNVYMYMHK